MRSGRLLRFSILRRRPLLYRCPECISVTDRPHDHAATHAGRPPNPARIEGERFLDVIVDDTIERCMASPRHGQPVAEPSEIRLDPAGLDPPAYGSLNAEGMARQLAAALRRTQEYVGDQILPAKPGWSWFDALEAYYAWRPDARPEPSTPGATIES